ncbi:MAG: SpoIID/LytB domain-containing protein, partial [Halobacteriales archaeon]|nr:SpoIID/LytB domain-containing protein [Halobacteriales archaeon]
QGIWRDKGLDFDICATVTCQVFHGREIVETPKVGARWQKAVQDTAGQVLIYEEWPILARFFSSSGGETRPNEHVFPEDGHRPYLRTVEDPEDRESSPLAHWRVTFTRDQINEILAHGQRLSAVSPLKSIERVLSDGTRPDHIRVVGQNGETVELIAWEFRQFVSEIAPQLFPGEFPQERADGGAMPATFPTSRMDFTVENDKVVVDGYGWGHAVGMSQYGAKGKAEKGWIYDDILANYYGDIRPTVVDHSPERVRVGLSWDRSEFTVRADGPVRILTASGEAILDGGAWTVKVKEDGSLGLSGTDVKWQERTTESRRLPHPTPPAPEPDPELEVPNAEAAGVLNETTANEPLAYRLRSAIERANPVLTLFRLAF